MLTGILVVLGLALVNQSDAAVITNGDFETADLTGWNAYDPPFVTSDTGFRAAGATGAFSSGHYAVDFGGANRAAGETIWQQFSTIAGKQYTLDFDYGQFVIGDGPQSIEVSLKNAGDSAILFQNVVTAPSGKMDLSVMLDHYHYTFVATGTNTTIQFRDVSLTTHNSDGILDNVQIGAVPEPSSIILIGSSVVFYSLRRRRQNHECTRENQV